MFIENDLNQQSESIYFTDPLILRTWSSAAQLNAINRIIFSPTNVSRAADQHSAIEEDFFYGFLGEIGGATLLQKNVDYVGTTYNCNVMKCVWSM